MEVIWKWLYAEVITVIQIFVFGWSFKFEYIMCEDLERRENDELIKKIKRKDQK